MIGVGIVGYGEVGSALKNIYKNTPFNVEVKDKADNLLFKNITVLNICLPYSEHFFECVAEYIRLNKPLLTIIHSTVQPGITKKLQEAYAPNRFVVHSPIRGNHPLLSESLKKFVKYIGSDTEEGKHLTTAHFMCLGINSVCMKDSFSTELAKILCTTYYGICIAWHQQVKNLCNQYDLNFQEIMTEWNTSYNAGYTEISMSNVNRPVLYPPEGKIGGHCIIPNAEILNKFVKIPLVDEVLKLK